MVTEKTMQSAALYVFQVDPRATKNEIKADLENTYKVEVKEIRTSVLKGKKRVVGKKRKAKVMPLRKKAYVTLKKGDIADFGKN
jgi:ribosomal protein L23